MIKGTMIELFHMRRPVRPVSAAPAPPPSEPTFRRQVRTGLLGQEWAVALVLPTGRVWTESRGASGSEAAAQSAMDAAQARIARIFQATRQGTCPACAGREVTSP